MMESDLKSLEEKVTKLISLCTHLREENVRLRSDITRTKDNMLQVSNKLEGLLESLPESAESTGLES